MLVDFDYVVMGSYGGFFNREVGGLDLNCRKENLSVVLRSIWRGGRGRRVGRSLVGCRRERGKRRWV